VTEETRPLVKNQKHKPCGCVITELSNDTTQMSPCVPCGLMEVARAMGSNGQTRDAGAKSIQVDRDQWSIEDAVKKSLEE